MPRIGDIITVKGRGPCEVLEYPLESGIVYSDHTTRMVHCYALVVDKGGRLWIAYDWWGDGTRWDDSTMDHDILNPVDSIFSNAPAVFVADDTMTYSTSYSFGPEPVQKEPVGPALGNYPAPGRWDWLFFWRR